MTKVFSNYATPFITGLFLVSLVSGVALFFHVGPGGFHGMHEWLSMVLILPFVLHLWKNWRPMTNYLKHMPMALALAVSVVAAAAFLLPVSGGTQTAGGPPQFQLAHLILNQPLDQAAPALGLTADGLAAKLTAAGYAVTDKAQPLNAIAATAGKTEADLAVLLVGGAS